MNSNSYDPIMELAKMIKSEIDTITEIDEAMEKVKYETENNVSKSEVHKDCYRYDDNLVAIDMLKDVTKIIEGIERNDVRDIRSAFQSLKDHTTEFEKVFDYFLSTGSYNY